MEQRKKNNNKGELMLESLIVYSVTIMLLFFVLAIFSVLYQRWNMQTIANEAATRMAQTYRFSTAEEISGKVEEEDIVAVGKYRYMFGYEGKLEKSVEDRIKAYAGWRLTNTTYAKAVTEPTCDVDIERDAMGRRHLEVTISGQYWVPFYEILDFFGYEQITSYEVKAYASCVDLIDYINFVDYVKTQTSLDQFGSSAIGLLDAIFGLFDNIFNN